MLALLDVLLVLGFTLRLNRLVMTDDVGGWWLRGPAYRWAGYTEEDLTWKQKLVSGITCPWCVGFWLGILTLLSLYIAGGPGHAWELWRWVAGAFTLNWVAAHLGSRLGDAGYAEED